MQYCTCSTFTSVAISCERVNPWIHSCLKQKVVICKQYGIISKGSCLYCSKWFKRSICNSGLIYKNATEESKRATEWLLRVVFNIFNIEWHQTCSVFLVLVLCCSGGCLLCMLCFLHELFPLIKQIDADNSFANYLTSCWKCVS